MLGRAARLDVRASHVAAHGPDSRPASTPHHRQLPRIEQHRAGPAVDPGAAGLDRARLPRAPRAVRARRPRPHNAPARRHRHGVPSAVDRHGRGNDPLIHTLGPSPARVWDQTAGPAACGWLPRVSRLDVVELSRASRGRALDCSASHQTQALRQLPRVGARMARARSSDIARARKAVLSWPMTKAIVLLSGGVDSAVTLAIAKALDHELYALSFDYGQRHAAELACATRIAGKARAIHTIVRISSFGGSALLGSGPVPKGDGECIGIPPTYVPARNTIFLAYALALAEVLNARDIFIGVNAVDYSGYPDCRPEYLAAFSAMANLATKAGIEGHGPAIHAPLIDMSKADIIVCGLEC